jgi:hypothetical protein
MDVWYDLVVRELCDPDGIARQVLDDAEALRPLVPDDDEDAEVEAA